VHQLSAIPADPPAALRLYPLIEVETFEA